MRWISRRRGSSGSKADDKQNSVVSFLRRPARSTREEDYAVVVCNFTPVVREGYRIGVPGEGTYVPRR